MPARIEDQFHEAQAIANQMIPCLPNVTDKVLCKPKEQNRRLYQIAHYLCLEKTPYPRSLKAVHIYETVASYKRAATADGTSFKIDDGRSTFEQDYGKMDGMDEWTIRDLYDSTASFIEKYRSIETNETMLKESTYHQGNLGMATTEGMRNRKRLSAFHELFFDYLTYLFKYQYAGFREAANLFSPEQWAKVLSPLRPTIETYVLPHYQPRTMEYLFLKFAGLFRQAIREWIPFGFVYSRSVIDATAALIAYELIRMRDEYRNDEVNDSNLQRKEQNYDYFVRLFSAYMDKATVSIA